LSPGLIILGPHQEKPLQVFVRENNIDRALKVLKRKMQREGVFREMRQHRFYEKPSERKTRRRAEGIRRMRKQARKQAVRDGLIPASRKKPAEGGRGGAFAQGRAPMDGPQ
jgi:small subunit ribosomal protein S21